MTRTTAPGRPAGGGTRAGERRSEPVAAETLEDAAFRRPILPRAEVEHRREDWGSHENLPRVPSLRDCR